MWLVKWTNLQRAAAWKTKDPGLNGELSVVRELKHNEISSERETLLLVTLHYDKCYCLIELYTNDNRQ